MFLVDDTSRNLRPSTSVPDYTHPPIISVHPPPRFSAPTPAPPQIMPLPPT